MKDSFRSAGTGFRDTLMTGEASSFAAQERQTFAIIDTYELICFSFLGRNSRLVASSFNGLQRFPVFHQRWNTARIVGTGSGTRRGPPDVSFIASVEPSPIEVSDDLDTVEGRNKNRKKKLFRSSLLNRK